MFGQSITLVVLPRTENEKECYEDHTIDSDYLQCKDVFKENYSSITVKNKFEICSMHF